MLGRSESFRIICRRVGHAGAERVSEAARDLATSRFSLTQPDLEQKRSFQLDLVSTAVVEAARDSLVIGPG
jgi:hypothetical protein